MGPFITMSGHGHAILRAPGRYILHTTVQYPIGAMIECFGSAADDRMNDAYFEWPDGHCTVEVPLHI